ncbi:hypothetical protein D0Z07_8999 [Hyphodiscus hymeniophilus]|uniref:BTB domain-containing protein n=1 Tax=Hyphodiscus hymeniophilus TaxID=353542 RepID=A0A9P6SMZ8_9HELO|nr:hypothetical protein D0Z07_8999 [Hyphodiscus hymeniophilus]
MESSLLFVSIVSSRIFKFSVGEAVDGTSTEVAVHEEAIAQLSEPLRILTKSGPSARAGKATWKDVSKDTFERFVQYAYTGDYSIPKTEKRRFVPRAEELPKLESEEPQATAAPESEPNPPAESEPEKISEEHVLTTDFRTLSLPLLAPRDNYEGTCEPSVDFEKDHSYSNVFLSHASLYVLGHVQLIENLKALALYKLHKTLCTFELDSENIGDITDLARYAYSGEDKNAEEGTGGLRGLVCQYMAIHARELHKDVKFMNLLVGGGQIVQDFIKLQLQRVN